MRTPAVSTAIVLFILHLFTLRAHALFFPDGSHNHPVFPSSGSIIAIEPPTRIVRRQTTPLSTLKPIISVTNTTGWADQTNQLCMNSLNLTTITNPAGVVPCYNVLSFDPNTGIFLSEVRIFQVVSMEQQSVLAGATGSGVLFEFPHAQITSSPGGENLDATLEKMNAMLMKRQNSNLGQVNIVDVFYMNGTADITQSTSQKQLLTPTTATLNLNMSSQNTAYSMTDSLVLFANGLFSPSFIAAESASPVSSTATATSTGFVLPGISFGIVPIGFYMYSAYWALLTAILLWGAWNKRKYRDAFRRRRAAVLNFTAGKKVYR